MKSRGSKRTVSGRAEGDLRTAGLPQVLDQELPRREILRRGGVGAGAFAFGGLLAACSKKVAPTGGSGKVQHGFIRFVFAPDPVWEYVNNSGIRQKMEQQSGMRIIDQSSWDEFGVYAGGNADVASAASFEVPGLQQQTGRPATIFGKYNVDRSILVVPASSNAQTLQDLKGAKIAVWDTVSSTIIWGLLAKKLYNLDFRTGGGDFQLVLTDITNTGALAAKGQVDGALVLPDFNVPVLMNREVRILYGGKAAPELYAPLVNAPAGYQGPMINIFLAGTDWYNSHPEEVAFFLKVWQAGVDAWQADRNKIIESFPDDFGWKTPKELQYIESYIAAKDWFVRSVYLDDAWVQTESKIFQLLYDAGLSKSSEVPRFDVVPPS